MRDENGIDVEAVVNEFELKLERLKTLYEQFFMGIAKREPTVPLKDVVRVMRSLDGLKIRNTGIRFRYRALVQRFNSYRNYWNRTMRAIENGTYHRDVARMSRKLARQGVSLPSGVRFNNPAAMERALSDAYQSSKEGADNDQGGTPEAQAQETPDSPETSATTAAQANAAALFAPASEPEDALGPIDLGDEAPEIPPGSPRAAGGAGAAGPGAAATGRGASPQAASRKPGQPPPLPAAARAAGGSPPKPAPAGAPGNGGAGAAASARSRRDVSEEEMRSIYRRFVKAKKMCGEDVSSVKYESLAKSIKTQLPKIQKQNPGKDVEFQVVIRGGRAVIRAQPK